jgi:hypothetical protein
VVNLDFLLIGQAFTSLLAAASIALIGVNQSLAFCSETAAV